MCQFESDQRHHSLEAPFIFLNKKYGNKIPTDVDFAIYIDFKKDIGKPQRIFQTADLLIKALQKVDKYLCSTIDSKISPKQ